MTEWPPVPATFVDGLADTLLDPNVLSDIYFRYELCQLIFYQGIFEGQIFSRGDLEGLYVRSREIKRTKQIGESVAGFVNLMAKQNFIRGRDGYVIPQSREIKRSTKLIMDTSPQSLARFFDWAVGLGQEARAEDIGIGQLAHTATLYRDQVS